MIGLILRSASLTQVYQDYVHPACLGVLHGHSSNSGSLFTILMFISYSNLCEVSHELLDAIIVVIIIIIIMILLVVLDLQHGWRCNVVPSHRCLWRG